MSPQDKDLSYKAREAVRQKTLKATIDGINEELKSDRSKVRLAIYKDTHVRLRFTVDGKRIDCTPPGVDLTFAGVEKARDCAIRIDLAIKGGRYSKEWLDREIYERKPKTEPTQKERVLTFGDVYKGFSPKYHAYRRADSEATDRQKKRTLNNYLKQLEIAQREAQIADSTPFDDKLIQRLLGLHAEGTDKRFRLRETLSITCTLYGITYNFKGIGKRPKPKRRNIPTEEQILECWQSFDRIYDNPQADKSAIEPYRWLFGLIATYGLRPQEAFAIDLKLSFKPERDYWIVLNQSLTDGLKTGDRWIAPLPVEWVKKFNLTTPNYPANEGGKDPRYKVNKLARYLGTHKIGYAKDGEFQEVNNYDLRHAYAIRCRRSGIGLLDSADLLGHDPATHHKQYHRWITPEERIASVREALNRNQN
jgi:integrase